MAIDGWAPGEILSPELHQHRFISMGCPCAVNLYAEHESQARRGFDLAELETRRLDQKYSHYREDSYLARIQRQAQCSGGVNVDRETAALLDYAETQFGISDGMFDITTRRLSALWDRIKSIPDQREVSKALNKTGWEKVRWNGLNLATVPGMEFDLGGIVKEYAADRVAALLIKAGFESGYVDLGGDMHFLGPHPNGNPWRAGIRNPVNRTEPMAIVGLYSGGLASSGDYERYSEIDGTRYSHIINPRTGWPVNFGDAGMSSVSVSAPSCLVAGSVTTLSMLLPKSKSVPFLEQSGLNWFAV